MLGLPAGFDIFSIGTISGAAMAIGAAVVRWWLESRQREQDRYDHAVGYVRLGDASAARASADENRDPGAAVRRFLVFMIVFFGVAGPALAALVAMSVTYETEVSHPDSLFGLFAAYTETIWTTVRGYSVPLYVSNSVLGVFGYYFGFGSVSRALRR